MVVIAQLADTLATPPDLAFLWRKQSAQGAQEGRFSAAVSTSHVQKRSRIQVEAQPREKSAISAPALQIDNLEHEPAIISVVFRGRWSPLAVLPRPKLFGSVVRPWEPERETVTPESKLHNYRFVTELTKQTDLWSAGAATGTLGQRSKTRKGTNEDRESVQYGTTCR